MASDSTERSTRRVGFGTIAFVIIMAALTLLFAFLGHWQMQRLAWKEDLIARVEQRAGSAPVELPALNAWGDIAPGDWEYRPVEVTGRYLDAPPILAFTSLGAPRGQYGGPGYWVMNAFAPDSGGLVFINRGFVPEPMRDQFMQLDDLPQGELRLEGLARVSEATNLFTPEADAEARTLYVRNIAQLAALSGVDETEVLPLTIDLAAGEGAELPQPGETVMTFSNRHLGYAWTWYGLAVIVPVMTIFWLAKTRRQ